MGEQERMRAPFVEPVDIAFEQCLALGGGERPVRDRGHGVALHGLAEGYIVKYAVAELVDLIRAHGVNSTAKLRRHARPCRCGRRDSKASPCRQRRASRSSSKARRRYCPPSTSARALPPRPAPRGAPS